jgi:hypothetical protein
VNVEMYRRGGLQQWDRAAVREGEFCGSGSPVDAERFIAVLLYAQVALGLWTVCTAWSVLRVAMHSERVRWVCA